MSIVRLKGVIENVRYKVFLNRPLTEYNFADFDINSARMTGLIQDEQLTLGVARWVSPKRTRSYPLARVYDIYGTAKKVAIIPVIKDEGIGGDCDRINFITLSMMNLLNVYILLVWYDDASVNPRRTGKITAQKLPAGYVNEGLRAVMDYQQSALHWNITHFERDFERVYTRAIEAYERIAAKTSVQMHTTASHLEALNRFLIDSAFDQGSFRRVTLAGSLNAARREMTSSHVQEYLMDGDKGYIALSNFLGGEYHLTIDEVFTEDGTLVLQESKNTGTDKLPKEGDIKDGLLKLILYSNIDKLFGDDDRLITFRVQLKLTGRLQGSLRLPADETLIDNFCSQNQLSKTQRHLLRKLQQEVAYNQAEYGRKIRVLITGNL